MKGRTHNIQAGIVVLIMVGSHEGHISFGTVTHSPSRRKRSVCSLKLYEVWPFVIQIWG